MTRDQSNVARAIALLAGKRLRHASDGLLTALAVLALGLVVAILLSGGP